MKPDIRWQALLAAVGLALVLGLMSYQVQSSALCTTSVAASGGALVEGRVGRPLAINPLLSDDYPVDRELSNLIFDGLVIFDAAGKPQPALAESWQYSDDGLTLTVTLRDGVTWHDGQPLTADDVVFTYQLLQSNELPAPAALRGLWSQVVIEKVDDRTVSFTLAEPYSPFIQALARGILPAHLLSGVPPAQIATADFNRQPIGTGPFMVEAEQDWQRTGRLDLVPNPAYWREGTQLANLEYHFYPTEEAVLEAYRAGDLQAIDGLSPSSIGQITALDDARLFTSLAPRYSQLLFRQSDSGPASLKQKEVRQALAYALDRQGLVDSVLNGQGVVFEGPYLPGNWAANPGIMTSYTYQPETAAALLDAAGWVLPPGGVTRQQGGAPLTLRVLALDTTQNRAVGEALAAAWNAAGVSTELSYATDVATLRQSLAERAFDVALVDIVPPGDPDLYDFWSQEAIIRGQNYAGWNNRRASEALEEARKLFSPAERLPYYESFLRQFDGDLPALTLFQSVNLYVLRDTVQQAEVGRFDQPRDKYASFADWFLPYRDVTVPCPPSG